MSDYVYNYGDGDKTWTLNEYDSLTIDSDTASHVIGIQELDETTKIVFDNYSSLNVGGRPGAIIVDGVTVVSNEATSVYITPIDTINRNYVYNYGDGNKIWTLSEYDTLTIDSDTASHIIGIQELDETTKIVFDNYSSLNIGGRPGAIIVDGETIVSNEMPTVTSGTMDITTYDSDMYANTSDIVNLDSLGITPNRIVGIRQVADARTTVVYDTYRSLNIWGYPGEVISNGQTIISHNPQESFAFIITVTFLIIGLLIAFIYPKKTRLYIIITVLIITAILFYFCFNPISSQLIYDKIIFLNGGI